MTIRAVWFDVGEALIDETREYGTWADWLGVPRHTFSAVFGAVIARGEDYRQVFQYFRPGFDLDEARQDRVDNGFGEYLNGHDLYDDVRPCFNELRNAGYFVGIAGNQTSRAGKFIRELNLPADVIATSDDWGVSKPSDEFFQYLIEVSGHAASEILYVGDRLDNDIAPAQRAGLRVAHIVRGPWGHILPRSQYKTPDLTLYTLADLAFKLTSSAWLSEPAGYEQDAKTANDEDVSTETVELKRVLVNSEPLPLDFSRYGDQLNHYLNEELTGERSAYGPPAATQEFVSYLEFSVVPEGLNVVFATKLEENWTEEYRRLVNAFIAASKRLVKEEPEYRDWWALIGPLGSQLQGMQYLVESGHVGSIEVSAATSPFLDIDHSSLPDLHGWSASESCPVLVKGSTQGFDWQATAEGATVELNRLCALISLQLDTYWSIRQRVKPGVDEPEGWRIPRGPAGLDLEGFGSGIGVRMDFSLAPWLNDAWERVAESEILARSLAAHYEGLGLERDHVSYAVIAFVGAIEGIGAATIPLEKCETCKNVKSAGKRFRDALKPVLSSKERSDLYSIYRNRSETAHSGYLFGGEALRGHFAMPRSIAGAPAHLQFRYESVAKLREASRRLLVHYLSGVETLPAPTSTVGGDVDPDS